MTLRAGGAAVSPPERANVLLPRDLCTSAIYWVSDGAAQRRQRGCLKAGTQEGRMSSETDLRNYLAKVERAYRAGNATEHTYRSYLKDLLERLAPGITATNEP